MNHDISQIESEPSTFMSDLVIAVIAVEVCLYIAAIVSMAWGWV